MNNNNVCKSTITMAMAEAMTVVYGNGQIEAMNSISAVSTSTADIIIVIGVIMIIIILKRHRSG